MKRRVVWSEGYGLLESLGRLLVAAFAEVDGSYVAQRIRRGVEPDRPLIASKCIGLPSQNLVGGTQSFEGAGVLRLQLDRA
jgi:hypothetical protein